MGGGGGAGALSCLSRLPGLTAPPYISPHPLKGLAFAFVSKPPPPPSAHNGAFQSAHLSSVTCLQPELPLYSPFSFLPFVFLFFWPAPMHASHTIRSKGKSSRGGGGGGRCGWGCVCVCVETDTQREEGQRGACRETQERTDWLGSNNDRYSTHTLKHTHTYTHARVICLTHSCPFHTLRGACSYVHRRVSGSSAC